MGGGKPSWLGLEAKAGEDSGGWEGEAGLENSIDKCNSMAPPANMRCRT